MELWSYARVLCVLRVELTLQPLDVSSAILSWALLHTLGVDDVPSENLSMDIMDHSPAIFEINTYIKFSLWFPYSLLIQSLAS